MHLANPFNNPLGTKGLAVYSSDLSIISSTDLSLVFGSVGVWEERGGMNVSVEIPSSMTHCVILFQ